MSKGTPKIKIQMGKEVVEQKEYLSVVGFYFGEPNEADTKEYTNSLTAEFEVEQS